MYYIVTMAVLDGRDYLLKKASSLRFGHLSEHTMLNELKRNETQCTDPASLYYIVKEFAFEVFYDHDDGIRSLDHIVSGLLISTQALS